MKLNFFLFDMENILTPMHDFNRELAPLFFNAFFNKILLNCDLRNQIYLSQNFFVFVENIKLSYIFSLTMSLNGLSYMLTIICMTFDINAILNQTLYSFVIFNQICPVSFHDI